MPAVIVADDTSVKEHSSTPSASPALSQTSSPPTHPPQSSLSGSDTCGNGIRGNGVCADGLCCSEYGWCGKTPDYCGSSPLPPTRRPTLKPSFYPTLRPSQKPVASASTPNPTPLPTPLLLQSTPNPTTLSTPPLPSTDHPTQLPPTYNPTQMDTVPLLPPTPYPTQMDTPQQSTSRPSPQPSTPNPTQKPSQQRKGCITNNIYDQIDVDIEQLKNQITDDKTRAHFLGGIVRLVAHDFMDYDRNNSTHKFGPDGCFDFSHSANAGLPQDVWCDSCHLKNLYTTKYPTLSRADFWIASANAVIRQSSVNNELDLRDTFEWGRVDRDSCPGSALRLPTPKGCSQTEGVFISRMGLTWSDAVALLGAHTLGGGNIRFSGHQGSWSPNSVEAQVFDKNYYEEVLMNPWRPRNLGTKTEDWTTGNGVDRVMLNTDLCLVMDIEENMPCCSSNSCTDSGAGLSKCPRLPDNHPRSEAFDAFEEYLGGAFPNENQEPFYNAFREAWRKATKVGQQNLFPLSDNCDIESN